MSVIHEDAVSSRAYFVNISPTTWITSFMSPQVGASFGPRLSMLAITRSAKSRTLMERDSSSARSTAIASSER